MNIKITQIIILLILSSTIIYGLNNTDQRICMDTCVKEKNNPILCADECGLQKRSLQNITYQNNTNKSINCIDNCLLIKNNSFECDKICNSPQLIKNNNSFQKENTCLIKCLNKGISLDICEQDCGNLVKADRFSWESFWGMMGFLAVIISSYFGWYYHKKKRKEAIIFLEMVDSTYQNYKFQRDVCEIELTKIRGILEAEFQKGNIDENNFGFLIDKIDKYKKEIK